MEMIEVLDSAGICIGVKPPPPGAAGSPPLADPHSPNAFPPPSLPPLSPFPDAAWHSVYRAYGDLVGFDPWHWAAAHAVLCARMSRHLTFQHAYPHYGMEFILIVIRTGSGKTTALRLAAELLGPNAHIKSGVQSGQALAEALASITWGTGKSSHLALSVSPVPTLLVENEFTRFLTQASFAQSTLTESACELYDGPDSFSVNRVFRNSPLTVPTPSLSILAATTQDLFYSALKSRTLSSGLLNRFLIFNLDGSRKEAVAPSYSPSKVRALAKSIQELTNLGKNAGQARVGVGEKGSHGGFTWSDDARDFPPAGSPEPGTEPSVEDIGSGQPTPTPWNLGTAETNVVDFYLAPAFQVYEDWWNRVSPITEDSPLAPWFSRVQAHYHRIALCCAYYEHRTRVSKADSQCAEAVMDYAIASTTTLAEVGMLPNRDTMPWIAKSWAETWIVDLINKSPHSPRSLQVRCYNLKDGAVKWLLVKAALDDMLKRGSLYLQSTGQNHLLKLSNEMR